MTASMITALLWFVCANVIAMFPSKHAHWPAAYVLVAIGVPLLAWVAYENSLWIAGLFLLAAASILRWPLRYLWRWVARVSRREAEG